MMQTDAIYGVLGAPLTNSGTSRWSRDFWISLPTIYLPENIPMARMLVIALWATVFLAAALPRLTFAQLQQIDYPGSVALQATNWSTSVNFPQFDPAFGQLVSVQVSATGRCAGTARFECLDAAPAVINTTFSGRVTVTRPDLLDLVTVQPTTVISESVGAFDGVVDFAGVSGRTYSGLDVSDTEVSGSLTTPSTLSIFIGSPGAPGLVTLPVAAQGLSSLTGAGNLISSFQTNVGVDILVSYTFDPSSAIRIQRRSTRPVPGRIVDSFLTVRNTGFIAKANLEVIESVDPNYFRFVDAAPPAMADDVTLRTLGLVAWRIPTLAPGEVVVLTYRAEIDPHIPLGTTFPTGPAWAGYDLATSWLQCASVTEDYVGDCDCAEPCSTAQCTASPSECLAFRASCLSQFCGTQAQTCLRTTREFAVTCFDATANTVSRFSEPTTVVGPLDPNEKRSISPLYVQPNERLTYAIHYENIGTLPALDVRITDTLDQNLDPSSLQMQPQGSYNTDSRTVTWNLTGINLQPGETGNVFLIASPNPGLPPGTVVRNQAGIQFETQPPIQTNVVENRIDGVRPTGTMATLPATSFSEEIPLSWSGSDPVGVTLDYTIYVARDGGNYQPLLVNTTTTSTIFTGQPGSRYDFYCIARDSAGNVEVQATDFEARTTISSSGSSLCAGDGGSAACPCGNFSPLGAGAGCLNSLGTGARLTTEGAPSITQGNLILVGSDMPDCPVVYFQGTALVNGGQGLPFGDGLRCAGGVVIRLATKVNVGGTSQYPGAADLPVAVRGLVQPGNQRVYQAWYRNSADWCTPAGFNLTNARRVNWAL